MTEGLDEKLGRLPRADAPPERDPLFRIRVLERRERQRFQHRSQMLLAAAVVVAVFPALILTLGTSLIAPGLIAAFCIAVIAAGLFSIRGVLQVVRRLRGS